jgi:Mycothiol maleylpyruvate isomerase N-terminal domain
MRTRAEQIAAIRADQQFWRELAAEVGSDRYAEPGPMGEWSFGDMAGHLLGWRNRTIARLEAFSRDEPEPPDPWPADLEEDDAINAWIRDRHADRSPDQLVEDHDASYDRLASIIEAMPDAKLMDPDAIPWVGTALVDVDFTGHLHEEHIPSVRAWLDEHPR